MREIPTYNPDFEEYIRQGEPGQKERAQIWRTAIGLQQVDGLETSEYMKETVKRNIEGEISIDEVQQLIHAYYISKTDHEPGDEEREDAGKLQKPAQTQENNAGKLQKPAFKTETIKRVYELIHSNPRIKQAQMATILDMDDSTIERATVWLRKNGYINKEHSKIKGVWQLV